MRPEVLQQFLNSVDESTAWEADRGESKKYILDAFEVDAVCTFIRQIWPEGARTNRLSSSFIERFASDDL